MTLWLERAPGVFEGIPNPPVDENRLSILIKLSGLPAGTRLSHRFSTWSPRPDGDRAKKLVYNFATGIRPHHFLTLIGPPGTGKTHLALAAAWSWLEEGHGSVNYHHVENLLDELRRGYNKHENKPGEDTDVILNYVSKCSLAILDDMGAEAVTEWAWSKLDSIVDSRYIRKLPLIVTTNVAPALLPPRIADRLFEGQIIQLKAESYRKREKNT